MLSKDSAHARPNPQEQSTDVHSIPTNINADTHIQSQSLTTTTASTRPSQPLSQTLPPLIFGTATFNYQFNPDPYALHPDAIVAAALTTGIRAFDTSPYYGPAETILGAALHSPTLASHPTLSTLPRSSYHLLTKCGRITGSEFDYSPSWLRHSVHRSLRRLRTTYLDVVYLHDVEFVSPAEVLSGIRTLRALRNESGVVRYVGICGYPVATLCALAEMIRAETGEALDIVQSYANFTVQNQRLVTTDALRRLCDAGVDVVANASPLGMGLCRSQGVPVGAMGNWHPAPDGLRAACRRAAEYVEGELGDRLEAVAVRFAMENWLVEGARVGSRGLIPAEAVDALANRERPTGSLDGSDKPRLGVNVMGVSKLSELEDTMVVYDAIIKASSEESNERRDQIRTITRRIREGMLGPEYTDFAWESPEAGFRNTRKEFGVSIAEQDEFDKMYAEEEETPVGKIEASTI